MEFVHDMEMEVPECSLETPPGDQEPITVRGAMLCSHSVTQVGHNTAAGICARRFSLVRATLNYVRRMFMH